MNVDGDGTAADSDTDSTWSDAESGEDDEPQPQLDLAARLAAKKADPVFRHLHRSKGFLWLATRPMLSGEWSQAGVMLTIGGAQRWWAETPVSEWPPHAEYIRAASSLESDHVLIRSLTIRKRSQEDSGRLPGSLGRPPAGARVHRRANRPLAQEPDGRLGRLPSRRLRVAAVAQSYEGE